MADFKSTLSLDSSQHDKALQQSEQEIGKYSKKVKDAQTDVRNLIKAEREAAKQKAELDKRIQSMRNSFQGVIGSLGKFIPQIAAAATAIGTFNGVINSTQTTADAFGATMEQTKGVIDLFFTSIATGSFDNFINNLKSVTSAARDAYEAMDDLGSFTARAMPEMTDLQAKIDDALEKARVAKTKGNKKEWEEQIALAKEYNDQLNKLNSQYGNKEVTAGVNVLNEKLASKGVSMSKEEMEYYFSGSHYNEVSANAQKYADALEAVAKAKEKVNAVSPSGNDKMISNAIAQLNEALETLNNLNDPKYKKSWAASQINDNDEAVKNAIKNLYGYNQALRTISSNTNKINKIEAQGVTTSSNSSGKETAQRASYISNPNTIVGKSINDIKTELAHWQKVYDESGTESGRLYALNMIKTLKEELSKIEDGGSSVLDNIVKSILSGVSISAPIKELSTNLEESRENAISLINAMGGLLSAMGSLVKGGDVFATIAQGAMQAVPAIMTLVASESALAVAKGTASAKNWYEMIAAAATVATAIISTISSVKQQTSKFAEGGIVGGSSRIGDTQLARVNSGEMILNSRQQENLFNLINSGVNNNRSMSNGSVEFKINGQELYGVLKNYSSKRNKII